MLLLLTLLFALVASGCGNRKTKPAYPSVDELAQCEPGECVEAELSFMHWADSEHHRGHMPYHCDPGNELDGPPNPNVTRLIFVVHGVIGITPQDLAGLNVPPGLYQLRNVQNAMKRAQKLDETIDPKTIAIVAPTFQRTTGWQPYTDEDKRNWTWQGTLWNTGTRAIANETGTGIIKAEQVSSFDILDEFMRAALIKFPNLEHLIIVGHSAGGQTVHRYALLGVGIHERLESEGIHIRYMPANPGLYAFPMQLRKMPPGRSSVTPGIGRGDTTDWQWGAPKGCKGYDDWGYGLGALTRADGDRAVRAANYAIERYLRPIDRKLARQAMRDEGGSAWQEAARKALRLQYASREVWHIQAANDFESAFDTNCRATVQGRSRWERFINFQETWTKLVGIPAPNLHFVALDASHPHSSAVVYSSDAGVHLLFH